MPAIETTLVLTASNEQQAELFRRELKQRADLGLLGEVDQFLVILDPGGRPAGSGGSTIEVLRQVRGGAASLSDTLRGRRLLIVHAAGRSQRMPAYALCGKTFAPVPGPPVSALPYTLLDAQLNVYLELPSRPDGQIVIFSGDVLARFDPKTLDLDRPGLTGVASRESKETAAGHGVYAGIAEDGAVRRFLQKPSLEEMQRLGCLDRHGKAPVDLGIMSFTPEFGEKLLELSRFTEPSGAPLDFYTEIACGMGSQTTLEEYAQAVARCGLSGLDAEQLEPIWSALHAQPFHCALAGRCDFLHFGTTADHVRSCERLYYESLDPRERPRRGPAVVLCGLSESQVRGDEAVVEGCQGAGALVLAGRNLVVGAEVQDTVVLRRGVCLDVLPGKTEDGQPRYFFRIYGIDDTFKGALSEGSCTFLNKPMRRWLDRHGIPQEELWPHVEPEHRSLWNARLFPADERRDQADLVLWMQNAKVPKKRVQQWLRDRRWSMEEMSALADGEAFRQIRQRIRAGQIVGALPASLDSPYPLSADDLAHLLRGIAEPLAVVSRIAEAARSAVPLERARILHTLGSALDKLPLAQSQALREEKAVRDCLPARPDSAGLRDAAFEALCEALEASVGGFPDTLQCSIKKDQIVWGRSPVRLDLAGGWTDTPPYCLEQGGVVVNAAVNLNGQPPVQVFARVTSDPYITLSSIDLGLRERVENLESLLNYRSPEATFSIPKAALALCGFSPEFHNWPDGATLSQMLEKFGGGIDLTLLCAVPKGSGLGTSSILGAVLIAVLHRLAGIELTHRDLFHRVLVLEQVLTTGGGWQDQIGGVLGGLKRVSAAPGLVPDPLIHWLPHDLLRSSLTGGTAVLYYTGLTRLAKSILQHVVGRYLNRDKAALRVLTKLKEETERVRDAAEQRNLHELGTALWRVWDLNTTLDPEATTPAVEALMDRVRPYALGAKLLGAGGGGFLLAVCPDTASAEHLIEDLDANPPNELARPFDFNVSETGLEVTVS